MKLLPWWNIGIVSAVVAIVAVVILSCPDRGERLSATPHAKEYHAPTTTFVSMPTSNGGVVMTPMHIPARYRVLYWCEWELTDPTWEWYELAPHEWEALDVPSYEAWKNSRELAEAAQ